MNVSLPSTHAPLVSVIIPVHNGAQWLADTLNAIYSQTYQSFEIILVDDASTDNLQDILQSLMDPRLHVVHLSKNIGVSAARNCGITMAHGAYIAFCDADDVCKINRLEQQVAYLECNVEIGMCGSAFTCFDGQIRETVRNPCEDHEIKIALMQGNCFGLSTIMGRSDIFKKYQYDEALSVSEDYDLWTRLSCAGVRFANLPGSLLLYRLHPQQASRHMGGKLDHTARLIRSIYCAELLGDAQLIGRIRSETISQNDLDNAAKRIMIYFELHPEVTARSFRFMLAWMYQKIPHHGVRQWLHWRRIQSQLGLKLDRNYCLNTALLAFLPLRIEHKYFDTLSKLKR